MNAMKPLAGSNVSYFNGEKLEVENREVTWQLGVGITGDLNKKWSIYSEVSRNWGGLLGWEIRGGLKVKF